MMLNRVSLNTIGLNRIGLNRIGKPSRASSDRPYIDPEVLASLKAVCICYGKSNDDPDRAVVKNLVDPDNPFVISNAAYTEGSGYADKDSPYYGAFITDGIDDLITSTKTASEMGITEACTVISMIHQIDKPSNYITTNNIRTLGIVVGRNAISEIGKTGIYGWYKDNIQGSTINVINNILGDKADYTASASSNTNLSSKFSVVGYISNDSIVETSQVAWYWTIIANKVLTTDQINQVIAYFNLDRTLKPDILCNTIKQGITNENHAEFGDKLIDYSGNGRDIQLNNIAWNKESGIDDDGALRLDGVNDFGKVTGMPIYKDYTVVADYERLKIGYIEDKGTPAILSKSYTAGQGAFLMNLIGSTGEHMNAYTFGNANSAIFNDLSKKIYYQSKYKMQGFDMTIGSGVDGDSLWLGVVRDNDSRFFNGAIYSLMSFPYSMSKFLIERQLKKHKLGTLYPDMVEFRPIVKSNLPYSSITYSVNPGEYISVDSMVTITVTLPNTSDKLMEVSCNAISDISISGDNGVYEITGKIVKSPQKINMIISSYLTMLNNETLISNETLIKNE